MLCILIFGILAVANSGADIMAQITNTIITASGRIDPRVYNNAALPLGRFRICDRMHDGACAGRAAMGRPLGYCEPSAPEAEWKGPSYCMTGPRALMIHAASVSSETSAREVRRKYGDKHGN